MMNPTYHFRQMRELLGEYEPSREKSLAATKLDECEMWLDKCAPTKEAVERDQRAPGPDEIRHGGYTGPAAHTFTTRCDGSHPIGEQCNLPADPGSHL